MFTNSTIELQSMLLDKIKDMTARTHTSASKLGLSAPKVEQQEIYEQITTNKKVLKSYLGIDATNDECKRLHQSLVDIVSQSDLATKHLVLTNALDAWDSALSPTTTNLQDAKRSLQGQSIPMAICERALKKFNEHVQMSMKQSSAETFINDTSANRFEGLSLIRSLVPKENVKQCSMLGDLL